MEKAFGSTGQTGISVSVSGQDKQCCVEFKISEKRIVYPEVRCRRCHLESSGWMDTGLTRLVSVRVSNRVPGERLVTCESHVRKRAFVQVRFWR